MVVSIVLAGGERCCPHLPAGPGSGFCSEKPMPMAHQNSGGGGRGCVWLPCDLSDVFAHGAREGMIPGDLLGLFWGRGFGSTQVIVLMTKGGPGLGHTAPRTRFLLATSLWAAHLLRLENSGGGCSILTEKGIQISGEYCLWK